MPDQRRRHNVRQYSGGRPGSASDRSEESAINDEAEQNIIDAETELSQAQKQETNHRVFRKNASLVVSALIILTMLGLILAMARIAIWEPNSPIFENTAHMIVYVGAPVARITTVVTARLITAIRMFDRMGIQATGGRFQSRRELRRAIRNGESH